MKRTAALATVIALALVGCGKKDIDNVSEAQECLDTSTSTTALACMSKVEGLTSAASNVIRCSAYFVDQGFADPARLASVSQQITTTTTPDASSVAALTAMGFVASKYSMTANDNLSATALTACTASASSGLIYLSSMSRIATATLKDAGFDSTTGIAPTTTDMQNAICVGSPSNTTKAAMGNAALAAYNKNCIGKDISGDVMCLQYQAAIASNSDPTAIGTSLITTICTP